MGKVCVPLMAQSVEAMKAQMAEAKAAGADLVELRLDCIEDFDPETSLPELLNGRLLPVIVAYRPHWEGGRYAGDEAPRLHVLQMAARLGSDYVDVELPCAKKFLSQCKLQAENSVTRILVSSYNFEFTPSELELVELYDEMVATGADVVRLTTTAQTITDASRMLDLQARAQHSSIMSVMGPKGLIARVLALKFGAPITFASLRCGPDNEQPTLEDLLKIYRVKTMNRDTKVYGVIGNPVNHSKGPWFFNPSFAIKGHNAVYLHLHVDNIASFLKTFDRPDFAGFSVTIPFKEDALLCADVVDAVAKDIGAVNTLVRAKDGKLQGFNTDSDGALMAIEDGLRAIGHDPKDESPVRGKTLVLIGAGGAGKAIAFGAKRRGAEVIVANRNLNKAEQLAASCGGEAIPLGELASLPRRAGMILANSTSVGMHPTEGDTPYPDKEALKNYELVFDAVYTPVETRLLREAKEMGATVVSGIEMFIRLGICQFERFTEGPAPLEVMRSIVQSMQ